MRSGGSRISANGAAAWQRLAFCLALWLTGLLPALAAFTSANYVIPSATLDAGGGTAFSADYHGSGSLGGLGGVIVTPGDGVTLRGGFIGQWNSSPAAGLDVIRVTDVTEVMLSSTNLFSNDADPDGCALELLGVELGSGEPGVLEVAPGGFRLRIPAEFAGEISLHYTVGDGEGGETTGLAVVIVGVPTGKDDPILPEVTWPPLADIPYGTPLGVAQQTAHSDVPGSFLYLDEPGTILPFGAHQMLSALFLPTDSTNYAVVTVTNFINVTKATLTVSAVRVERFAGVPNPGLTPFYSGWVGSDGPSLLGGAPLLQTTAEIDSLPGEYPIAVSAGTLAASSYQFAFVDGVLAVLPPAEPGPRILGTSATPVAITDKQSVSPFTGVTLFNPGDPARNLAVTITLSDPLKGRFDSLGGFVEGGGRVYTFTGPPAAATAALRGLVFNPVENLLPVGAAETMIFSLTVGDGLVAPVGDSRTRVAVTSVNDLPVPRTLSLERPTGRTVKVAIAKLLANVNDPDPEPLTFVSVSNPSYNGGEVAVDGGWVIYVPATGFNDTDRFEYTVSDGHGDSVTGVVVVLVRQQDGSPTKNVISLVPGGGGSMRVTFIGIAGRDYAVEASPSLTEPSWVRLGTRVAGANGVFEYLDTAAGGFPERFYRAVRP